MTTTAPPAPVEPSAEERTVPVLTMLDRCESAAVVLQDNGRPGRGRCGAQAFVRAIMTSGHDLLFCAHHADEHQTVLLSKGARLIDERGRINLKPTDAKASRGF